MISLIRGLDREDKLSLGALALMVGGGLMAWSNPFGSDGVRLLILGLCFAPAGVYFVWMSEKRAAVSVANATVPGSAMVIASIVAIVLGLFKLF